MKDHQQKMVRIHSLEDVSTFFCSCYPRKITLLILQVSTSHQQKTMTFLIDHPKTSSCDPRTRHLHCNIPPSKEKHSDSKDSV